MSACISSEGEYSEHLLPESGPLEDRFVCRRCFVLAESDLLNHIAAVTAQRDEAVATADELAASVLLLAHDAHPVYANTAGWRGGIGGQAMTPSCSIVDPPPDALWTQCDMPTEVARDWIRTRDTDWEATKKRLRDRWTAALTPVSTTHATEEHTP